MGNNEREGSRECGSCFGTGEVGSDAGVMDCPDCGGGGVLPHPSALIEWRMRDIERAHPKSKSTAHGDIAWLMAELRRCRKALTEVVTLAQEPNADAALFSRIQVVAGDALSLFQVSPVDDAGETS